jgi:hypothetical protein
VRLWWARQAWASLWGRCIGTVIKPLRTGILSPPGRPDTPNPGQRLHEAVVMRWRRAATGRVSGFCLVSFTLHGPFRKPAMTLRLTQIQHTTCMGDLEIRRPLAPMSLRVFI